MKADEIAPTMRRLRKGPLHQSKGAKPLAMSLEEVERMLPHRDPFRFIDRLASVDLERQTLEAEYDVRVDDPLFKGHFPGRPLLPAALQIEAVGQACLCMWNALENDNSASRDIVVTKVVHAQFFHPVRPGDLMKLNATVLYSDDLIVSAAGQSWVGDTLCAAVIVEVGIVE